MSDIASPTGAAAPAVNHGAADQNAWPLVPAERTWSSWQLLIALTTAGAATWCYIIGEYVGYYLNFTQGIATLIAGSMFGMLLSTLAAVPTCAKFGIDSIAASRPQFGSRAWAIPATLQFLSIMGWNCLLLIFFGKSASQFLVALGLVDASAAHLVVPSATLLASALVFLFLLRGATGVDRVSKILVAHVLVGLWMLYILVTGRSAELATAVPAYANPNPLWNFMTGIELGIAPALSWWPYIGAMVRMAPSGRAAAVPSMLGLGASVALLSIMGVAGILVLQVSDPAEWLRTVGGTTYAIVALAFVTAANLGTTVAGIYCSAIGLRNYSFAEKLPWPVLLAATIAPVALVGVLLPELFFANFGTFLAFIAITFAPICGMQIVDYYILRKGRISVRAIFEGRAGTAYRFWGGVNPAAIAGMAAGFCTYIYLLNPITYESRFPYEYISASLPTVVVAGLVYYLVTRLVVMPAGKGGYRS